MAAGRPSRCSQRLFHYQIDTCKFILGPDRYIPLWGRSGHICCLQFNLYRKVWAPLSSSLVINAFVAPSVPWGSVSLPCVCAYTHTDSLAHTLNWQSKSQRPLKSCMLQVPWEGAGGLAPQDSTEAEREQGFPNSQSDLCIFFGSAWLPRTNSVYHVALT